MKIILDILQKAGGWHHGLHLHIEKPKAAPTLVKPTEKKTTGKKQKAA